VVAIFFNSATPYPTGALRKAVPPQNAPTNSPDAVGNRAVYVVSDLSTNETLLQQVFLTAGAYQIGFSAGERLRERGRCAVRGDRREPQPRELRGLRRSGDDLADLQRRDQHPRRRVLHCVVLVQHEPGSVEGHRRRSGLHHRR
jgi:hypothetical protein